LSEELRAGQCSQIQGTGTVSGRVYEGAKDPEGEAIVRTVSIALDFSFAHHGNTLKRLLGCYMKYK
jgi:hypothetical protein